MINPFWFDTVLWKRHRENDGRASQVAGQTCRWIETRYSKVRVIDTGGDKPVLFMVPDGPCFIEHFESLIRLAQKEWRVVVFDMPGFGDSFPRQSYRHSFEQASEVIHQVVTELQLTAVTLSFSCANGFYAIHYAIQHPEVIQKIVLMQTPGLIGMRPWLKRSVPRVFTIPVLGQLTTYLKRFEIPRVWYKVALPKGSMLRTPMTELSIEKIQAGSCNCLGSVVQGLIAMDQALLQGLKMPVLMIWGTKDFSHLNTDPKSFLEVVPHAKIIYWEDCGHFPNLEFPERFLDLLREKS